LKLDEDRVRGTRERLGLTLAMVAQRAGTSKNTVLSAEHGADIRPTTARKIADALHVEIEDLLGEQTHPLAEALPSQDRLFPNGGLEERGVPTAAELNAVEALNDRAAHLEAVLETARRQSIPLDIWKLESDYALDIASLALPLIEREHLRTSLLPVAARFTELTYAVLDGLQDAGAAEEAKRRRAQMREIRIA
jgi:DNA-binding XRE family transcriptional regulator